MKPYLLFLADLCTAQHGIQDGLPAAAPPPADVLACARAFAMPPLDRNRFTTDATCDATLDRLLTAMAACHMPAAAQTALFNVRAAGVATMAALMRSVLSGSIPVETVAEHVFVAAALEVHFARLAAQLDAAQLMPVGDGACPACGGPPVSSMVMGWPGAHGTRFCACALCGTMWNYGSEIVIMFAGAGREWDGAAFFPAVASSGGPLDNPAARLRLRELENRIDNDRLVLNEGQLFDKWGRRMTVQEVASR